jgi:catechol 2,3-dioxygenase-like lactoylglutathione lyase family enzyme
MPIADLHHVSINVDDLAVAQPFYTDVLGLTLLPRPDLGIAGAWLAAGDRQVHLIETPRVPADVGQHFAFRVTDLDGTIAALEAKGVKVSGVFETEVSRQVAFHDPCGNRLEFNEPKASAG